jgi:hypothetical protein
VCSLLTGIICAEILTAGSVPLQSATVLVGSPIYVIPLPKHRQAARGDKAAESFRQERIQRCDLEVQGNRSGAGTLSDMKIVSIGSLHNRSAALPTNRAWLATTSKPDDEHSASSPSR